MGTALLHLGAVTSSSLEPLIAWVRSIPREQWVFRGDMESNKTCVLNPSVTPELWKPAAPMVDALITDAAAQYFKPGYWNRLVLSCVPAGEKILPHTDDFSDAIRNKSYHCHIPLITDQAVTMGFEAGTEHLHQGHLYVLDETFRHWVDNPSAIDRVHLLFGYFPHDGKYELTSP